MILEASTSKASILNKHMAILSLKYFFFFFTELWLPDITIRLTTCLAFLTLWLLLLCFKFTSKEWTHETQCTPSLTSIGRTLGSLTLTETLLFGPGHGMYLPGLVSNEPCCFKMPDDCCWDVSSNHNKNHQGESSHSISSERRHEYESSPH